MSAIRQGELATARPVRADDRQLVAQEVALVCGHVPGDPTQPCAIGRDRQRLRSPWEVVVRVEADQLQVDGVEVPSQVEAQRTRRALGAEQLQPRAVLGSYDYLVGAVVPGVMDRRSLFDEPSVTGRVGGDILEHTGVDDRVVVAGQQMQPVVAGDGDLDAVGNVPERRPCGRCAKYGRAEMARWAV